MSTTTVQTTPSLTPDLFPDLLQEKFHDIPKLSREQCGHIRHFHNLASALDGDWSLMGSPETGQEFDTALRYQLATMAYATGAAHYHHLPVMRSMFKSLMERLIAKMLRRDVWGYWYMTSQSGIKTDPDITELRKPWADPVCKENIMYSGHLLLMISLYTMLFYDRRFDAPDGITFHWNPLFWGMGPETYTYSRQSLQQTVIKEMEENNWIGACCEPNLVFIVCNQFPLIAMKYNDTINGTNITDDVIKKYQAAWAEKGMISDNGLFKMFYMVRRGITVPTEEIASSAWSMSFMPWNYKRVLEMYHSVGVGFLHRIDDRINLNPPVVANHIRTLVREEGVDPHDPTTLRRARKRSGGLKTNSPFPWVFPTFGYVCQWVSEVGGSPDLDGLLRHADQYLHPTWRDGGLYYTRCDDDWDEDGNYTGMEPSSGNAGIGYARLNVKHGQKKMWDHPWTESAVLSRPWIDQVSLEHDVDCLRGHWDSDRNAMVATFRTWHGNDVLIRPTIRNLPAGRYGIYVNGKLTKVSEITARDGLIDLEITVGGLDLDLVVIHAAE